MSDRSLMVALWFFSLLLCVWGEPVLKPWSDCFTMTQWQYMSLIRNDSSPTISYEKQISYMYYDFNNLRYRSDYHTVRGLGAVNATSIWINDTLYIIDYTQPSIQCQVIDMGFGMPTPDWFVDADFVEYIELLQGRDDQVIRTFHFSKESPDGPFHYFAVDASDQTPFRLSAPEMTETQHVVNNWYDYHPCTSLDDQLFDYYKDVCPDNTATIHHQEAREFVNSALGWMYHLALTMKSY